MRGRVRSYLKKIKQLIPYSHHKDFIMISLRILSLKFDRILHGNNFPDIYN